MSSINSITHPPVTNRQTPDKAPKQFTEDEQKRIDELKKIDTQVRAHEAAHQAAAGGLSRGKSFSYTTGPDGGQYAVGGEVQIDTSPIPNNPQATVAKMQQVQRAALAPADPSGQDLAVASQAASTAQKARTEDSQPKDTYQNNRSNSIFKPYSQPAPSGSLFSAREICTICQSTTSCMHLAVS